MFQAVPLAVVAMFAVSGVRAQGDINCAHHSTNGCSIPLGAPFFYKQHFNSSCNRHDVCYGCGARYGLSREQCDSAFLGDMKFACTTIARRKRRSFSSSSSVHRHKRTICAWFADQYYWAVSSFAELYFYELHQTEPYCQEPWVKTCLPDPRIQPASPPGGGPGTPGGSSIVGLLESIGSQLSQPGNQPARPGQPRGQPSGQSSTQPSIFGLLGRVGTQLVRSLSQPSQQGQASQPRQPIDQPSQPHPPSFQPNQPQSQPSRLIQPTAPSHTRQATGWGPQDEARLRAANSRLSAQLQTQPRAVVLPGESVAGPPQSAGSGQAGSGQTSQQTSSQSTRQPGLLGLLGQVVRQLG